jgi:hypothetical protein
MKQTVLRRLLVLWRKRLASLLTGWKARRM